MEKAITAGMVAGLTAALMGCLIYFGVTDHRASVERERAETAAFHRMQRKTQLFLAEQEADARRWADSHPGENR